jgi:hypothetical protein
VLLSELDGQQADRVTKQKMRTHYVGLYFLFVICNPEERSSEPHLSSLDLDVQDRRSCWRIPTLLCLEDARMTAELHIFLLGLVPRIPLCCFMGCVVWHRHLQVEVWGTTWLRVRHTSALPRPAKRDCPSAEKR